MPNGLTCIQTITSHVGASRWYADASEPIGEIRSQREIRTPYASSPTWTVYLWRDRPCVLLETSHKHYSVFQVTGPIDDYGAFDAALDGGGQP